MNKIRAIFLSRWDFKEKSIHVIEKTPEAYVKADNSLRSQIVRSGVKVANKKLWTWKDQMNSEIRRVGA